MAQRLVIPVEDNNGLKSRVAQHFGRAPYFAVIDLDDKGTVSHVDFQANKGEHHGGSGHPHENILALKPDVIVAFGMGPGGIQSFRKAQIRVLKAEQNVAEEVVNAFKQGTLKELLGGCEHAHHHHVIDE